MILAKLIEKIGLEIMSTKDLFADSAFSVLSTSVKRLFWGRWLVASEPSTFQKALAIHIATTTRSAGNRNAGRNR
jgi:hypothetical protein